jgi:hypothetical protein
MIKTKRSIANVDVINNFINYFNRKGMINSDNYVTSNIPVILILQPHKLT